MPGREPSLRASCSVHEKHSEIRQRRLKDLASALERFLDEHEITPARATLVKRLH